MTDPHVWARHVCDHHNFSTRPVEPGGNHPWGSICPDEPQPCWYRGMKKSLRQVGLEQAEVALRKLMGPFGFIRAGHASSPSLNRSGSSRPRSTKLRRDRDSFASDQTRRAVDAVQSLPSPTNVKT